MNIRTVRNSVNKPLAIILAFLLIFTSLGFDNSAKAAEIPVVTETGTFTIYELVDGQRVPVPGIDLEIVYNMDTNIKEVLTTDEEGKVTFTGIAYEAYTVNILTTPDWEDVEPINWRLSFPELDKSWTLTRVAPVNDGSARIFVKDQEGYAVVGAKVTITLDSDQTVIFTATTDDEGRADFADLPRGAYTATVTEVPEGYINNNDTMSFNNDPIDVDSSEDPLIVTIEPLKTTGVLINTYRFLEGQDPVLTEIYRNQNNLPEDYTLVSARTGATYNSNPLHSNKTLVSFKDIPSGTYTLIMNLPEGNTLSHFGDEVNKVTGSKTAIVVIPRNPAYFTNFNLYIEQNPEAIKETTVTFNPNGGTFTGAFEEYGTGNYTVTKQQFEPLVQSSEWPYDYRNVERQNHDANSWRYATENGKVINNTFGLKTQMIADNWQDTTLVMNWKPYTLTIDTSEEGVTFNEGANIIRPDENDVITVPYQFETKISKEGYSLAGYEVLSGTVKVNGETVRELGKYKTVVVLESDAVIKPIWEVTAGNFRIHLYGSNPGELDDVYTLTLIAEDGTEYPLTTKSWSSSYRQFEVDNIPNGTYTLKVEGSEFNSNDYLIERSGGSKVDSESVQVNEDGTYTINIKFEDNSAAGFVRYRIQEKALELGVEVRDSDNKRTDEVTVTVEDEEGIVYAGSFNEYKQWLSSTTQFSTANKNILGKGTYTITIGNLPERTIAVINETVATQKAIATDEYNVFTIELTGEDDQRVWGAFKFAEKPINVVTIDPNGGTIEEEYRVTEVKIGEKYTVPYAFRSKLAKEGFSLSGYTVEGTLLDSKGEAVMEVPYYGGTYTPETDVTLTAIWKIPTGNFRIHLFGSNPGELDDLYTLMLIAEDGTEYPLTTRSWSSSYRQFEVDNIPNGTYTLKVEGSEFNSNDYLIERSGGSKVAAESARANEDGTYTINIQFEDDAIAGFVRYRIQEKALELGVEVRDLDNKRTDEISVTVTDEAGLVYTGSFNEYKQWLSSTAQFSSSNRNILGKGTYTITLGNLPEGQVAVINETVATQKAVAMEEENVFTIELTGEEGQRVWAAFRLELKPFYLVNIDANGGTLDEAFATTKVYVGEAYNLPSREEANLVNPGSTLTGYTVEGTLLDETGKAVTTIPVDSAVYTPQSDVTLTAVWKESAGTFRIHFYDDNPIVQRDRYAITLTAEDGTVYTLRTYQYWPTHRQWYIDNIPSGTYTVEVVGFDAQNKKYTFENGAMVGVANQSSVDNRDGTFTVTVEFEDNVNRAYVRYDLKDLPLEKAEGYAIGGINVRIEPNSTSAILGKIPKGTLVEGTVHPLYTNWVKIEFNDQVGYIYKPLLTDETPKMEGTLVGSTNVRSIPSTSGEILGTLRKDSFVTGKLSKENPNWLEIDYNGQIGYIWRAFIE